VPFPELRVELFKEANMILGQFDVVVLVMLFQTGQSLMFKQYIVSLPDSPDRSDADMNAAGDKLLADFEGAVNRICKAIIQDGLFLFFAGAAGVGVSGASDFVQQAF
jgi:hypothetical protein